MIVSVISSIGRPRPSAIRAADSERPTWPSFFAATPSLNSWRVRPAPTLARRGPRRLAASTTRVTRDGVDPDARRRHREDQPVHHETRVDARARAPPRPSPSPSGRSAAPSERAAAPDTRALRRSTRCAGRPRSPPRSGAASRGGATPCTAPRRRRGCARPRWRRRARRRCRCTVTPGNAPSRSDDSGFPALSGAGSAAPSSVDLVARRPGPCRPRCRSGRGRRERRGRWSISSSAHDSMRHRLRLRNARRGRPAGARAPRPSSAASEATAIR